jgi:uncharacterized protein (TIGR02145 family)
MQNPIFRQSLLFFFCWRLRRHFVALCATQLLTSDFLLQAQAPQGIPYQAIARNASGAAIANTAVRVRFSIRDSIATGTIRYQETHNPTTSALGLFSVNVGKGTVVSGTFSGINWGRNAKFLQVELDPAGGTSYTDLGTTQMMSVPYALFAGNVNGFPAGGTEGQIIANCGGQPTWTTNGICPGRVSSLNCAGMQSSGQLYNGYASNFTISIPYNGGNGGPYSAATFSSSGVSGITAALAAGNFNNGAGSLNLVISGTPSSTGNATFQISIGGQSCSISLAVLTVTNPVDIDGNMYQTVTIGNQIWMKENLKVSKYRNGDPIPTNLDATWGSTTSGAYSIYNNDPANNTTYGKLYNWYAVADPRGLCPTGWQVPTDAEWYILENYLDPTVNDPNANGYRGTDVGGKLKSVSSLWTSPNTGATNSSGFTAFPGGYRDGGGIFNLVGGYGIWWSSTESPSSSIAWFRFLDGSAASSGRDLNPKTYGFSVRCLKD